MCPLKEAAQETPNQCAILSNSTSLTFAEFDKYIDQITDTSLLIRESASIHYIARFFAAWRRNQSIFPIHPKLPQLPTVSTAPPNSVLLYTSGSTGTPKIAVLSLSNLIANAEGALPFLDLRPGDQWRLTLPLYHVGGIGIVLRCVLARATIVLDDSPGITHLSCIPTHLYRSTPTYKKLKLLLVGGAPVPSYPYPITTTYGLTEMASMVTLNGQILPKREVKLAPDGEILVRGPCLFQNYLGDPKVFDWFATGDLGRYENGRLQILGRKDWMFISGGENIQPEEIERELCALPDVIEAVVIGKDDPEFGKRPIAIVKARKWFDLAQMQAFLRDRLPKFKIPIALHFLEEIPKKNDFKTNRFILSQIFNNQ